MKFRIWDKLNGKMIYPDCFEASRFSIDLNGVVCCDGVASKGYTALEFLEKHPQIGDVYIGDIIRVQNSPPWWDHDCVDSKSVTYSHYLIDDIRSYNYPLQIKNAVENVGNVLQNPKLSDQIRLDLES